MAFLYRKWIAIFAVITILGVNEIKALPNVTHSGYVDVDKTDGSQMFYTYYEAQERVTKNTPILLWLQVRFSQFPLEGSALTVLHCTCF